VIEKEHAIKQQWWGAYTRHNQIWKQITDTENNNTEEELVCENNSIMMYNPLLDK
jgi:vancomycin resistance protein VanW